MLIKLILHNRERRRSCPTTPSTTTREKITTENQLIPAAQDSLNLVTLYTAENDVLCVNSTLILWPQNYDRWLWGRAS